MNKICLALLSMCFLSACAVGPLVSQETARTVGDDKNEWLGGFGQAGYVIKYTRGIGKDFDFGVQWESLSLGIRFKYAFINQESGLSLAGALGAGTSIGGSHYYGDLLMSYKSGFFEPYSMVRVVSVKTDPLEFKDEDTGKMHFTVGRAQYVYGQATLGARFWLDPNWLLSMEASSLFSMTKDVKISSNVFAGAAFGYRY
ncbi:MAG: hypothetical protein KF799_00780 [Bdellovibrionales bacterium]|nr:hypothetical protein [Bdellovibrionales bacterium]